MDCQWAFEALKALFAKESVLQHPDLEQPFVIEADASDVAVGTILPQTNAQGQFLACAYTSRKLTETERAWAVCEKEGFAVQWALGMWWHFLKGARNPFEVWMDHKILEALQTPCQLSLKQVQWAQYFRQFWLTIIYISWQGKTSW